MASLNKVLLIGNLTRDVELRYAPGGKAVATLGMAVNSKYGKANEDEVLFIDVTVWDKTAENCAEYLSKGSGLFVEGRLKLRIWDQDGQKRSKIDVTANYVQFLDGARERKEAPASDDEVPF